MRFCPVRCFYTCQHQCYEYTGYGYQAWNQASESPEERRKSPKIANKGGVVALFRNNSVKQLKQHNTCSLLGTLGLRQQAFSAQAYKLQHLSEYAHLQVDAGH